jgi:hypothetical protein
MLYAMRLLRSALDRSRVPTIAVVLFVLVLSWGAAAATPVAKRLSALATRAFGGVLDSRYGAFKGYWTCPVGQQYGSEIYCEAEFRLAKTWYSVSATAHTSTAPISFSGISHVSWTRSWSPYSSKPLRGFSTPGTASVNSPYEDWAFIGAGAYYQWQKHRSFAVVDGYDGQGLGLGRFTLFRCRITQALVTCTNSFGDSMRYRPVA